MKYHNKVKNKKKWSHFARFCFVWFHLCRHQSHSRRTYSYSRRVRSHFAYGSDPLMQGSKLPARARSHLRRLGAILARFVAIHAGLRATCAGLGAMRRARAPRAGLGATCIRFQGPCCKFSCLEVIPTGFMAAEPCHPRL